MSAGEKVGGLPRPYTQETFKNRLNEFEELIKELTLQDVEATPEERRQMITENLRFDQFCDSIRALFGGDVRNQDLKSIYRKISTNPDAKVDWSELFGYFQSEHNEDDATVGEEVNVFTVSARRRVGDAAGDRKRRDIVVAVHYIPSADSYLTVSQKGAISVYSSKFRLQGCIDLDESAWATGCDYLPAMRRVIACTERSLVVWDSRTKGKNQQIFSIKPIEHSPQCVCSVPYANSALEDTVLFGDDHGCINLLTISAKDLAMKHSKGDKKFSQTIPVDPTKITHPIRRRKLHDDWVLRIKYFPELRCFASCSPSSTSSFVLEEVERIYDDKIDDSEIRGVSIPKGVNAFEYCARANIIATGGVDKVIRVWHPHIFSRPTGKLIGHLFTVVDIACNEKDQHVISLSTARVFRVWDIHTLTSLQVFTDNEERPGEKRIYSIIFCNKHEHLLSGSSVLDAWPLTRAVQDTMQVPHTHDRPISQVLVNKELNQITTICTETVIKVWDADTGKMVYQIPEAHGPNIEVTTVALDGTGYRLASGAHDGSLKIWDFGSGQEIKWRSGKGQDEDFSVVGLQYCTLQNERCLIAVGWNNRLQILLDSNDDYELPVLREFSDIHYMSKEVTLSPVGSGIGSFSARDPLPGIGSARGSAAITNIFRKDFILASRELTCLDVLRSDPEVLVSGCTNGDLVMWNIQKASIERVINLDESCPSPNGDSDSESTGRRKLMDKNTRAVNGVRFLVHKVRKLDPAYIKSLTKHHSEEESDGEGGSGLNTKRSRRYSKASKLSSSRRNSTLSNAQIAEIPVDKTMMEELRVKVEGSDAVSVPEKVPEGAAEGMQKITVDGVKTPIPNDGKGNQEHIKEIPRVSVAGTNLQEEESHYKTESSVMKKDKETTVVEEEDPADVDPDSRMIIDTYEPVLVSCHQDSFIRFWDPNDGTLYREVTALTRRQGSAVTAMCCDEDCNIMVTGDQKGYLTMWDVGEFLKDPESEKSDVLKQLMCWRAHLTKVVQLAYMDSHKAILSGSTDGSVRVWWGFKGRFVGFCGQPRPFNFPQSEETANTPILPYDISERPLAPVKKFSARQKLQAQSQKFEYPLIFDNQRWKPFRRSAYIPEERIKPTSYKDNELTDKKFFQSLIKPKAYNNHLESFKTADMRHGAVFRALPVYRVRTPAQPKTPEFSFPHAEEQSMQSVLFGLQGTQKAMRMFGKQKDSSPSKGGGKKTTPRGNLLTVPTSTSRASPVTSSGPSVTSPRRR